MIENMPAARSGRETVYPPISPDTNAAYTEMAAATTAATHTLTGSQMVKIQATDYPVRFRFLTATDADEVTSSNARDYVGASSAEYYAVPSGATGLSVMTVGGNATVVIVEF